MREAITSNYYRYYFLYDKMYILCIVLLFTVYLYIMELDVDSKLGTTSARFRIPCKFNTAIESI